MTNNSETILDIGCGNKKSTGALGLDIKAFPGVDVIADAFEHSLPFRSGTFTGVRCIHVLEHTDDLVRVMEEIHRVLKPGGLLHLISPHGATLRFLGDPTHKTPITCSTFNYFLPDYAYNFYGSARFLVEKIELDFGPDRNRKLHNRFLRWFWRKRMWQMEKILIFSGFNFSLDVCLRKMRREG